MKIRFPDFKTAHVLVVGDVMLDRYWHGSTSRISPEAPVPVVNVNDVDERPGGAGNVALNISNLGASVSLVGLTGDDEAAEILESRLIGANVDCSFQKVDGISTITKLRVISRHQQLIRLDFEDKMTSANTVDLSAAVESQISTANILVLSDYAKGALSDAQKLIEIANKHQVQVLVDPKGSNFEVYRNATLMTPNLSEFELVVGECQDEASLVEKGQKLIAELNLKALLITRGEQGMTLLQLSEKPLHFPAEAKEVFDVTGAGDTVIATLATALAAGDDLESATALANIAAGLVVAKLGTASVSSIELEATVSSVSESGLGVVTEEQLAVAVKEAKRKGEKIVMTNGCFDILHAGHVGYLSEAKELGTRLIVAVNDDASVTQLKGEGRPVNPIDRRMTVLSGLSSVDWVVPFSEDTPERIISKILPDLLVKGGDYKISEIAGASSVIVNGGEVKVLSFQDGLSTTAIINSLQ